MRKFKHWLYSFLPMWAVQTLKSELTQKQETIAELKAQLEKEKAYSQGLEYGIRCVRKIQIKVGEQKE